MNVTNTKKVFFSLQLLSFVGIAMPMEDDLIKYNRCLMNYHRCYQAYKCSLDSKGKHFGARSREQEKLQRKEVEQYKSEIKRFWDSPNFVNYTCKDQRFDIEEIEGGGFPIGWSKLEPDALYQPDCEEN